MADQIEKLDGLYILRETAYGYTKTQMNFAYSARRISSQETWAIYPVQTIRGRATTFAQSTRHCTRARTEDLVRIA